jgi:hypothetical protein
VIDSLRNEKETLAKSNQEISSKAEIYVKEISTLKSQVI